MKKIQDIRSNKDHENYKIYSLMFVIAFNFKIFSKLYYMIYIGLYWNCSI